MEYILPRAVKGRGEYFSLGTDTKGNNCVSICPISEWIGKILVLNALKW